jgi:hypothetical protein
MQVITRADAGISSIRLAKGLLSSCELHHRCYAENEGGHVSVAGTPAQCDRLCRVPRRCDLSQASQERRSIGLITSRARLYHHTEEHKRSQLRTKPRRPLTLVSSSNHLVLVDAQGHTCAWGLRGQVGPVRHTWASRVQRGMMHVRYRGVSGSDRRAVRTTRMTLNGHSNLRNDPSSAGQVQHLNDDFRREYPRYPTAGRAQRTIPRGRPHGVGRDR